MSARSAATRESIALAEERCQLFYWCQDTARTAFETGVQRVTRRLADQLVRIGATIVPIGWDDRSRRVVTLATRTESGGRTLDAIARRGAMLLVPEIPLSLAGMDLDPIQLGRAYGLRTAALVHDLIPIKLAADYSSEAVEVYRRYYRQFASADLVFATTRYVASDLRRYLEAEQLRIPPIEVVPLPAEFASVQRCRTPPPPRTSREPLRLTTVTTWEPRKNLLRLLCALRDVLRDPDLAISLDLVGRCGGFPAYEAAVIALAREVPSVTIHGFVSNEMLVKLYSSCHASIYPSLEEGFGLPIGESLWLGRPCLCHSGSAMAEVAPGGGTLMIDMSDEHAIADVLKRWAGQPQEISDLAGEAFARPLREWRAFADDLLQKCFGAPDEPARSASA